MKKISFLILFVCLFLFSGLIKPTLAEISYHYRYQILTQGTSYQEGQNLEIKLYINAENQQTQEGYVGVNYDQNVLSLTEVKKWDIFDIDVDSSQTGQIIIKGTTKTQFSGEAPIAYLYFKTLTNVSDLTSVLTVTGLALDETEPIDTEPTEIQVDAEPTQPTSITDSVSPSPTSIEPEAEPTSTVQIPNCPSIEGNGPHRMIIIPDGYNNLEEFATDAKKAVEYLKQTNLPPADFAKFAFNYSSDISHDYGIDINSESLAFDIPSARNVQQACDGDSFLILNAKYPTIKDTGGVGGFSMLKANMAVVFKHSLFVTPHEIGHSLPGLFDEYDMGQKSDRAANYFNCAGRDKARCQEWKEKYPADSQIGCFAVCGFRDWFRSTQFSAMNNNTQYMNNYNPPSLTMWEVFFSLY